MIQTKFYKTYRWVHIPTGRTGVESWSELDFKNADKLHPFITPEQGIPDIIAYMFVNKWNKGTHHDYRYWIED